jgi:PiT family inorganic phosphate transporter
MTLLIVLVLCVAFAIAFMNGSNDISKGTATLVGSGVADYKKAILWGTLWTAAGGLAAAFLAGAMLDRFGKGMLQAGVVPSLAAALATILGAAVWVGVASRTGLPVSTTHAIVGSLVGVATIAYGPAAVAWPALRAKVALPLLLSPIVSLVLTFLMARTARWFGASSKAESDCICVEEQPAVRAAAGNAGLAAGVYALQDTALVVETGSAESCAVERPVAARITLDHLHWLTSGGTSFARGLNDAPKMVAIVLAAATLAGSPALKPAAFVVVTLGMVAGSIVGGHRVTRVLAEKVTRMNHREGFFANLVTALLVGSGAGFGLPMSTTHVSAGSLFGIGAEANDGRTHWKIVGQIVAAWIITLPAAAILGIIIYLLLHKII